MSISKRYADMKRRERECKEEREEEEGREMREREFGTFSLLFLNVNILFSSMYVSFPPVFGCGDDV